MATQYVIHRLDEVGSTQDEARARFGGNQAAIVVAARQLQGRGRTGNEWVHAPRATAASVALHVDWPEGTLGLIPLVAGMAARRVVAEAAGVDLGLKWPNDLMRDSDKVGGVLVEASHDVVVAGCGINVWWPDAPSGMGAIGDADPGQDATFDLAEAWAQTFVESVAAGPGTWDREAYVATCVTLGTDVAWNPDGRGRALAIAPDGGLMVETDDGVVTLRSGEVRSVRPTTLGPASSPTDGGDGQEVEERGAEPA